MVQKLECAQNFTQVSLCPLEDSHHALPIGHTKEGDLNRIWFGRTQDRHTSNDAKRAFRSNKKLFHIISRVVFAQSGEAIQHGSIGKHSLNA
jgi:hypothetical protein